MKTLPLAEALDKIDRTFSIAAVLKDFERDRLSVYYKQSERGYRRYHSEAGSIHMAINEDGIFSPDGYYTQPRFVANQITAIGAQRVLEVGSGKGFNLDYLARQFPEVTFTGLDLTPLNINLARQKTADLANLTFQTGDFNQIPLPEAQFDLVFGVECLCYSLDNAQTLGELHRVLKPGGRLVIFDAWRNAGFEDFPQELQTAAKLLEASMAVRGGMNRIDHWQTVGTGLGWQTLEVTDVTEAIMPNVARLHRMAERYFNANGLVRRLSRLVQPYLVRNAIMALLCPTVLESGILGYYRVVAERPPSDTESS
ncbi:class I SAM-dependent methyltransferase [Leptolyngbya sp. PCC 6406]|uniref:class I SAM-dependent methyltransferase n=1 Tax=Leptolyngbya sp. PCC 6406 TaxID=1173264 RepID=UPI0002ACACB2|nr:class I SAM-dependent methyltransferase [Leptolyngbya sp. PCC 6406]